MPRLLVAGGTGYIGGGLLDVLHQQGFWLRALCRDPSRLRGPAHCNDIFVGHAPQTALTQISPIGDNLVHKIAITLSAVTPAVGYRVSGSGQWLRSKT